MSNFEKNRELGYIKYYRSTLPEYDYLEEKIKTREPPDEFNIWIEEPPSAAKLFRLLLLLASREEGLLKKGEVKRSWNCYVIYLSQFDWQKKLWIKPGIRTVRGWVDKLIKHDMVYKISQDPLLKESAVLGVINYKDYQSHEDKKEACKKSVTQYSRSSHAKRKQSDCEVSEESVAQHYKNLQEDINSSNSINMSNTNSEKPKEEKKPKTFPAYAVNFCSFFIDIFKAIDHPSSQFRAPKEKQTKHAWIKQADLLHKKDGHSIERIRELAIFARDEYVRYISGEEGTFFNIQSVPSFRKKIDSLASKYERLKNKSQNNQKTDDSLIGENLESGVIG